MCGVAAVGLAITVASTAYQAKTQRDAAKYNEEVARRNQEAEEARANAIREAGEIEAANVLEEGAQVISASRTGFAGGGVDVSQGAPNLWEVSVAREAGREAANVRTQAELTARGAEASAFSFAAESRLQRFRGRSAQRAGALKAGASLLAGASQTRGG